MLWSKNGKMTEKKYTIHSVKYNLIMNIILKVSAVLFPLITFPYVTRTLSEEGYGRVGFAVSVVSYFALVASLGIPSYAVRKCAQKRDNPNELAKAVKELLIINTVSLFVSYSAFVLCLLYIPALKEDNIIMLICSISIILQTFGVEWVYQAIEQYDYITVRNIIIKTISVLLLFVFVKSPADIIPYSVVTVIGSVGSNLFNIFRLPKVIDFSQKTTIDIRQHLKPIFLLFFYFAATTIYTNLDVVMLGFLTSKTIVGYYNASVKFKNVLVSVITALGAVALPRATYYLSNNDDENFTNLIRKSLNYVLLLSISLATYFTIEARQILLLFAGEKYANAINSMMWITPSIVFIGIGSITAWQLLIPLGRDRCTLIGAVVGAVVDFIINWLLIPRYGAVGASIGTLCAEICVVIVHAVGLRDIIRKFIDIGNIVKILIGTLVGVVGISWINNIMSAHSYFMVCFVSAVVFFLLFGLLELIMKEKTIYSIIESIKNRLNKKEMEKQR